MVQDLNRKGMRFIDMQVKSDDARSAAWWNQVANRLLVNPPPKDLFPKFARMMGVTGDRRVQRWAAEEVAQGSSEGWHQSGRVPAAR